MHRVVYDIETIGTPFEELDEKQQAYFLRWASSPEQEAAIRTQTALYSLTGQIVSIALLNPDTGKGRVYTIGKHKETEKSNVEYLFVATEKELLQRFWDDAKGYQQFITFNGRTFDAPYILIRSAINNVKQTTDIMGYRYKTIPHLDLADQLSFYGAARHLPLHFYCKAFHIESPKRENDGT